MTATLYKTFTLIELLVVVAIIAILASILLPALSSARSKADQINCVSRQKQLATVGLMYSQDNDGFSPMSTWRKGGKDWKPWWGHMVAPYLWSDYDIGSWSAPKSFPNTKNSMLKCSSHYKTTSDGGSSLAKKNFSYHMNSYIPKKMEAVEKPTASIWIYDAQYYGYPFFTSSKSFNFRGSNAYRAGHWRHRERITISLIDGHTEILPDYYHNNGYTDRGYILDAR